MSDSTKMKIDLIKTKVEILKLKANDHDWCCYVPKEVKQQLEEVLIDIDEELKKIKEQ